MKTVFVAPVLAAMLFILILAPHDATETHAQGPGRNPTEEPTKPPYIFRTPIFIQTFPPDTPVGSPTRSPISPLRTGQPTTNPTIAPSSSAPTVATTASSSTPTPTQNPESTGTQSENPISADFVLDLINFLACIFFIGFFVFATLAFLLYRRANA